MTPDSFLFFSLSCTDPEKIKEPSNHVEETEYVNGVNAINSSSSTAPTPKQFEAIKQQKELWEQGILL